MPKHRRRSRGARGSPLSLAVLGLLLLVGAAWQQLANNPAALAVVVALVVGGVVVYARWRNKAEHQRTVTHLRYRQFVDVTPAEFERAVGELFREHGFSVIRSGKTGDGGVDLEMSKDGLSFLGQCKRYTTEPISEPFIRDFYGALAHRRAHHGYFITTSYFTGPARAFARNKPITLIDERRLQQWLNESVLPESSHMQMPLGQLYSRGYAPPFNPYPSPVTPVPNMNRVARRPVRRRNKWQTVAIVLWSIILGACLLFAVIIIVANWHNPALGF